MDDQLADQAVVVGRDRIAGVDGAIQTHAQAARRVEVGDRARRRGEGLGVLGVDPHLDGVAFEMDVFLREGQRQTGGDADLFADQIDARDHFRDRVLDLQAGVHLDEEELAVFPQELDGADAQVADGGDGLVDRLADLLATLGRQGGRGGFFQHLLVAALQRAVAFAQVDDVAVAVGDDLDLDVARLLEVALHIDGAVAEGGLGLGLGRLHGLDQIVGGQGDLHAATAAAGGGLDDQREADGLGRLDGGFDGFHLAVRAGDAGDARFHDGLLGGDLVAHDPDMLGLGTDEGQAVGLDDLGEAGVFRQEAIARVDRLGAGDFRRRDDLRDVQIGLGRRRGADADAFVGQAHPHGAAVGLGVHGDGGDAHLLARPVDAQGDFAAVGDQDLGEHDGSQASSRTRASPYSTGWASPTRISDTTPSRGA
ncbi:hypothetical protein D3C86_1324300 [compost metagenome]